MQLLPNSILIALLITPIIYAQTNLSTQLQPKVTIKRDMKPATSDEFVVIGEASKCLNLVVQQENMDVVVSLFDPKGDLITKVDRSNTLRGPERLTFILPQTGAYKVVVSATNRYAAPSGYSIELEPFSLPTENELKRIKAEKFTTEGERQAYQPDTYQTGINNFKEAIKIWEELGDKYEQSVAYFGLGWIYFRMGEFENASVSFSHGAELAKSIQDLFMYGNCLRGAGFAFLNLGEYELAAYDFEKSAGIFHDLNLPIYVAPALYGSGIIKRIMGQNDAFQVLNESLVLRKQVNDIAGTILTLVELSRSKSNQQDFAVASMYLNEALEIQRKQFANSGNNTNFEGNIEVYAAMAWIYLNTDEYQKAEELLQNVLARRRRNKNITGEAEALHLLGLVYEGKQEWDQAINSFEESIKIIEKLGERTQNAKFRLSFVEQVQFYYVNYIHLLMKLHRLQPDKGFAERALEISEKSRSRSLFDRLNNSNLNQSNKIPMNLSGDLVKNRTSYLNLIRDLRRNKDTERKNSLINKISENVREKFDLERKIRQTSLMSSFSNVSFTSVSFNEIQGMLDDETLILEFGLYNDRKQGNSASYLWAVTKNEKESFYLPSKTRIEEKVRRLYSLLTLRNDRSSQSSNKEKELKISSAESEFEELSGELSNILIKPLLQNPRILANKKRIVIIPNAGLQTLPFAILPFPGPVDAKRQRLFEKFEIVTLPSISVLKVLRERRKKFQALENKSVAVIADPVFTKDDERFTFSLSQLNAKWDQNIQILRPVGFFEQEKLPRLFYSRWEANSISAYLAGRNKLIWLDFEANRDNFLNTNWANFQIMHIATHAVIDDEYPELSGLILSLFDKNRKPLDGVLLSGDILNLTLEADLVVLSACRTALGKQFRGEGVVGLTQNFMLAGSNRVMSSLWAVDDRATAQLMTIFYKNLIGKNPENPANALRLAQIEMSQNPRWKNPYYWGAFFVQGDF